MVLLFFLYYIPRKQGQKMLRERVEEAIGCHHQLLDELEKKEAWYRNSTGGQELNRRYRYTIEILENILKGEN
jgi:hypothetical protein